MVETKETRDNETQRLWEQWALFGETVASRNVVFEKQIGLVATTQTFSHRSKWQDAPGIINIFESVLAGIDARYKQGLYQNRHRFCMDIQTALQECLRAYRDHRETIIDSFQNKTLFTISKEKEPKVVVNCEKCKSYALINVHCPRCKSVFYCDQSCLKGHYSEHQQECAVLIQTIPRVLESLQVEMHSSSVNEVITLYFEHEMKFSLRTRGVKLFAELKNKLLKNKLMKAHKYLVKPYKNSLVVSPEALSPLYSPQRTPTPQIHLGHSASELKADSIEYDSIAKPVPFDPKEKEKAKETLAVDPHRNAKLPAIQEIKMVLMEMGAIVQDIIHESYPDKSSFIHIFLMP